MMMKLSLKKLINSILILFGFMLFINCSTSEYHKLVKSELGKNIQFDSLFFDISFGERKDDYFDKIQKLSKLAFKAMIGGALASWLTATVAGILI